MSTKWASPQRSSTSSGTSSGPPSEIAFSVIVFWTSWSFIARHKQVSAWRGDRRSTSERVHTPDPRAHGGDVQKNKTKENCRFTVILDRQSAVWLMHHEVRDSHLA